MSAPSQASPVYRFGVFELDPRRRELRRNGVKLKVQEQPYHVLLKLLEHSGEIVTREELRSALWHSDTFVDFENGLNTAIRRLRETLGDSADNPTFIETAPRHGYRFIQPVQGFADTETVRRKPVRQRLKARSVILRCATVLAVVFGLIIGVWRHLSLPKSRALPMTPFPFTSFPGAESAPSFSPDGNQIAFSWNGEEEDNFDIYVKTIGAEKPLRLTSDPAVDERPVWSPDGRFIAFRRHTQSEDGIFVVPVFGGRERKLRSLQLGVYWYLESFDWSPDGKSLVFSDSTSGHDGWSISLLSVENAEDNRS